MCCLCYRCIPTDCFLIQVHGFQRAWSAGGHAKDQIDLCCWCSRRLVIRISGYTGHGGSVRVTCSQKCGPCTWMGWLILVVFMEEVMSMFPNSQKIKLAGFEQPTKLQPSPDTTLFFNIVCLPFFAHISYSTYLGTIVRYSNYSSLLPLPNPFKNKGNIFRVYNFQK